MVTYKCDGCGTRARARWCGQFWGTPAGWWVAKLGGKAGGEKHACKDECRRALVPHVESFGAHFRRVDPAVEAGYNAKRRLSAIKRAHEKVMNAKKAKNPG